MATWLVLGVLQGLAEFLPISSSGHLALARTLLGVPAPPVSLELALHLGTALAVVTAYGPDVCGRWRAARAEAGLFALALVATGLVALPLEQAARAAFSNPPLVGYGFLATSVLLGLTLRRPPGGRPIRWWTALAVGAAQGLAVWPGLSRSGATIATALLLRTRPSDATRFSFLLSVPTILLAALVEVHEGGLGNVPAAPLVVATAVAFAVGRLAIAAVRRMAVAGRLGWWAIYTAVLGAIVVKVGSQS